MSLIYFLTSVFFCIIVTLVATLVGYWKWSHHYWGRKNLQFLAPQFPFGNVSDAIQGKESFNIVIKKIYEEMKSKQWKHGGIYIWSSPVYFLVNPDYIRNIMLQDFEHFTDRATYVNERSEPINAHVFNLRGTTWKNLRRKLTANFSSGQMKLMFQTLADNEVNLVKRVEEEILQNEGIDIKEIVSCFTIDILGSLAFGVGCNALENQSVPFRTYGQKVFAMTKFRRLKNIFSDNFPNLALYLNISLTPSDIADFFMKTVKDTVSYRENNNYTRNDFLQKLIEMKNTGSLKIEDIAAQSFIYFLAGFETSSTLMTFALYELSRNQDIQGKLRKEVNDVFEKHDGKLTYDSIQDMKYLNQVIDETLRIYPPVPVINRRCVKDYRVPDEDLVIEKGTSVIIPILGIHHDEEYYPNPETFDPERFSKENKKSRHNYAHIPFGSGPRICIGMRFGLIQAKVGLSCLIRNYQFTVNKRTLEPLKMQLHTTFLCAEGEIWLDAKKL